VRVKETATAYKAEKKIHSYNDLIELPDDGNRYEIIDGELIMSPSPKIIHQAVSRNLEYELITFAKKNNSGYVYHAPCDVFFDDFNVLQPDIIFITSQNKNIITEANIKGVPDLVMEILSPSTGYYDLVSKKEKYEQYGIKEYWIVDPEKQWIEIYVLENNAYKMYNRQDKEGQIESLILKDFSVKFKNIFTQE